MNLENEIKVSILRQDIEELQNQQQELARIFETKNKAIEQAVANYNTKIEALQREGQQVVDKLDNEREQLRGSYLILAQTVKKKQEQLDTILATDTEAVESEPTIIKPAILETPKKTTSKKSTKKIESSLTPEQIKAVEDLTSTKSESSKQEVQQNQIKNQSDIPEYLQDEYNKLK